LQTELNSVRTQAQEQIDEQTVDAEQGNVEQQAQQPDSAQSVSEAESGAQEIAPTPAAITPDDVLNEILQNACSYAEALSAIPEVMSACIASYKQRLIRPQPASAPAGCAVIVPSKRPRTLSEAKRLADALLGGAN
ncbi:MAG: hypothetical protein K2O39_04395, partial [Clostridiales bacterium]|nr:hypothetical protein [Clostridiales bacterium]